MTWQRADHGQHAAQAGDASRAMVIAIAGAGGCHPVAEPQAIAEQLVVATHQDRLRRAAIEDGEAVWHQVGEPRIAVFDEDRGPDATVASAVRRPVYRGQGAGRARSSRHRGRTRGAGHWSRGSRTPALRPSRTNLPWTTAPYWATGRRIVEHGRLRLRSQLSMFETLPSARWHIRGPWRFGRRLPNLARPGHYPAYRGRS